ncbi:MAG: type II secretion system minor pseudopilin GspH [Pseudomonadota bacterium]
MHAHTCQGERGFTLIEIMVTVFIIAIAVGLILPSIGWVKKTQVTEKDLRELAARVALARDEAALQGRNFGVRFYPDGYGFFDLDPDTGAWLTLSDDDLLTTQQFSDDILPALVIEERDIELEPPSKRDDDDDQLLDAFGNVIETATDVPHIVILASGEVTPFQLSLEKLGDDQFAMLESDFLGQLELVLSRE